MWLSEVIARSSALKHGFGTPVDARLGEGGVDAHREAVERIAVAVPRVDALARVHDDVGREVAVEVADRRRARVLERHAARDAADAVRGRDLERLRS